MLIAMPNLAHPIFSAPIDAVDSEMVRGFLELGLEESFTLDYKRNIDPVAETAAAMANSYGGIILVGVDPDPKNTNLGGELVGVAPSEKDRLVSKMANQYEPPGWTPDVIPVTVDGKHLLVVRVDHHSAPRPLVNKHQIKIRLDGSNQYADLRMIEALFQQGAAPTPSYSSDPRFSPAHTATPYQGGEAPTVFIRAATSMFLRPDAARLRFHGPTVDALIQALSAPSYTGSSELSERLHMLLQQVGTHSYVQPWWIDPSHGHGRFVRISAGHDRSLVGQARMELTCTAALANSGSSLDVFFDIAIWTAGQKVVGDLWVQACYEAVHALLANALPALTGSLLGSAPVPPPPTELHISSPADSHFGLGNFLNTDALGPRTGAGTLRPAGEYLPEDVVSRGDLAAAVTETLRNIALDWRYLHPELPTLNA
ncbi:helix-turn-helix domain-containing protein [Streptomyces griseoluteus]|uniref:AlbA family DNA-binding domain-containing protein n=1 Tax=Streptomyces griseoluteus TaxID=29306 RepID=UPI0036FB906E